MSQRIDTDAQLRVLVICTLLLYVKFLATTMVQGRRGFQAGTRLPEDATLPMAKGMPTGHAFDALLTSLAPEDPRRIAIEAELRWKRIVQNDLESMPLALIVFTTSILAGGNANVNIVTLVVYSTARILHTVCFACEHALLRMITWIVGVLCIVVAATNGVYAAVASA